MSQKVFEYWTEDDQLIVQGLGEFGSHLGWSEKPMFLEVGVYKGAFVKQVLSSNPGASVVGIDPYPFEEGEAIKSEMLSQIRAISNTENFTLFDKWASVPEALAFDFIHVDGEHTEVAVGQDLLQAAKRLKENGILCVDDVRARWFPGVSAAVFSFIRETKFRILADTGQKFYLVSREGLERSDLAFRATYGAFLEIFGGYHEWYPAAKMIQVPDVCGAPVLMVEPRVGGAVTARPFDRAKYWLRKGARFIAKAFARFA